jgi:signal transduction histidine kinase
MSMVRTGQARRMRVLTGAVPVWVDGRVTGAVQTVRDMSGCFGQARGAGANLESRTAQSAFLSNMSHQIRTPMHGIMGMIHLARMNAGGSVVRQYLELADKSARHLLELINDVLDLSRLDSGRARPLRKPFALREELAAALQRHTREARDKGLTLECRVDKAVPDRLVGDPDRLRQVVQNLVDNAVKFTSKGSVRVQVEQDPAEKGPARVRFIVRDTGMGIPAHRQESVFESFEQVPTPVHALYEGSGLGLTIARRLVELMGGEIGLESEEGRGSTFRFSLPLEPMAAPRAEEAEEARGRVVRPMRILVAEDNRVNQIYIQDLLESEGHTVALAETGQEALDKLAQGRFDMVIMDIRMPVMNGDEATRIIRNDPPRGVDPHIPVVALSAYALENEIEGYMRAGFDDYLTKPVDVAGLHRVLAGK